MSIDASWTAKEPGLLPAPLIRAAIAHAKAAGHAVTLLTPVDALEEWGASVDVLVDGAGDVALYQPDYAEDSFHLAISTSTGADRARWDELFEAADAIAGKLGLVFDDGGSLEKVRALAAERDELVEVTSVRVHIGLRVRPEREQERVIELEARALGRLPAEALEDLDEAVLRAVAFALSRTERAGAAKVTLAIVADWLEDLEGTVEESDDMVRLEREDATSITVMVDDDLDLVIVMAWPEIHLTMHAGLVLNDVSFSGGACLALAEDDEQPEGVWLFQTKLRASGLDKKTFLDAFTAFSDDLDDLIAEHPLPDEDDEDADDEQGDAEDGGDADDADEETDEDESDEDEGDEDA